MPGEVGTTGGSAKPESATETVAWATAMRTRSAPSAVAGSTGGGGRPSSCGTVLPAGFQPIFDVENTDV